MQTFMSFLLQNLFNNTIRGRGRPIAGIGLATSACIVYFDFNKNDISFFLRQQPRQQRNKYLFLFHSANNSIYRFYIEEHTKPFLLKGIS